MINNYYSNFIAVKNISKPNTCDVNKVLMFMFARCSVSDILVTDNGPQFSLEKFSSFARCWGFELITITPHYPQANGKAENAVKTIK